MPPKRIFQIGAGALIVFSGLSFSILKRQFIPREIASVSEPDFKNLLEAFHSASIPSGLHVLKKRFPDFMSRYVLMYHSGSLQSASYQNPRAIVFGKTGSLIMTFNGSPEQTAYASVETMEFDEAKGYEFRTLIFKKEVGADQALANIEPDEIDTDLTTPQVIVSKVNPRICLSCHGESNTRPIRESYPLWAGAYGSDTDALFTSSTGFRSLNTFELVGVDTEKVEYDRFQLSRDRHSRYSALLPLQTSFRSEDGEPRPNFVLDEIFSQQYTLRLRRAIAALNIPNDRLVLFLGELLCFPPEFQSSDIPREVHRAIWANEIQNVTTALALYGNSASRLVLNGVAISDGQNVQHVQMGVDDPRWNQKPFITNEARTRYQFVRGLIPNTNDFVAKAVAVVRSEPVGTDSTNERAYLAFRRLGINLADYAINLERAPILVTASSVYGQFAQDLLAEMKTRDPSGVLASLTIDNLCPTR